LEELEREEDIMAAQQEAELAEPELDELSIFSFFYSILFSFLNYCF
jgi:hypothetical protein